MWLADRWKDYEVIDCSCGEKLERWSKYILLRPDPQVIWDTPKTNKNWKKLNGHYHRSKKGGGEWEFFDLPQEWTINYSLPINKELTFHLKPFSFKHTGLFPEQAANWDWFSKKIYDAKKSGRDVKVLNLFAYTGGATLAAAAAGAAYADDYHALDIPPIVLFYHYNPERDILIDAKSKITLKMQKDTLPCGFTICLILRYNICAIIFQTVFYILDIRETLADEKKPRLIKHKDHTAKRIQAAGAFPTALRQARRHRRGHRAARAGRKAPG